MTGVEATLQVLRASPDTAVLVLTTAAGCGRTPLRHRRGRSRRRPTRPPGRRTHPHNLASYLGRAGRVEAAVQQVELLLPDQLRALGPDHPDTLTTRNDLALWRKRGQEPDEPQPRSRRSAREAGLR